MDLKPDPIPAGPIDGGPSALESADGVSEFQSVILGHYRDYGRRFPWRETQDPYAVLVSEIMLQQTQTDRVVGKYLAWLEALPSFERLAAAPFADVLELWRGLGYNRRAKALQDIAKRVVEEFGGRLPHDPEVLESFPGLGKATAASVTAFAFDAPVVFIETNIRRVFIHFFFADADSIPDRDLLPLVERTLYRPSPRTWYNALMDYGTLLKKALPNPNRRSAHYTRQSAFENSNRQIRGRILRVLGDVERGPRSYELSDLAVAVDFPEERVKKAVRGLVKDGMVAEDSGRYGLPD